MAVCFGNSRLSVWRLKGRHMVKVAVMASALVAGQVAALAPEHEARRLMLAIEEAVTDESWGEAGEYLNRLQLLEAEKPVDYHYYRGKVMLQSSHLNEAQSAFEAYVTKAGTEGEHYQEGLKLLTNIERARKAKAQAPQTSSDAKIAVIEPAGDSRLESLRKLYLADSDREALLLHLNSLLGTAAWRESQEVVRLDKRPDIEYRVNVSGNAIAIQEIKLNSAGGATRTATQVQVFGVNPQVEWGCESAVATCWVYDPRDGSRLFQLAPNRSQVEEVAQTLGKLIRNLQVPSGS
ncbi:hypothetical protein [Marinobacter salexigens]